MGGCDRKAVRNQARSNCQKTSSHSTKQYKACLDYTLKLYPVCIYRKAFYKKRAHS